MSLGKKSGVGGSESLWVAYHEVPQGPSYPFYSRVERIFRKREFDSFCEKLYCIRGSAPGSLFTSRLLKDSSTS